MISEFPLFSFTTLAGISAGACIANAVFPLKDDGKASWAFRLTCLILLGAGLIGCLGHLAHPELFLNAFANPSAGIAQEAYVSCLFGVLLVVEFVLALAGRTVPRALSTITGIVALAMVCIMGTAYIRFLGVEAWASLATVPLFAVGDFTMGVALYALFRRDAYHTGAFFAIAEVAALAAAASFIAEAVHFSSVGYDPMPFIIATVVGPVLMAAAALFAKKSDAKAWPVVVFACIVAGVCIARWTFYAASTL